MRDSACDMATCEGSTSSSSASRALWSATSAAATRWRAWAISSDLAGSRKSSSAFSASLSATRAFTTSCSSAAMSSWSRTASVWPATTLSPSFTGISATTPEEPKVMTSRFGKLRLPDMEICLMRSPRLTGTSCWSSSMLAESELPPPDRKRNAPTATTRMTTTIIAICQSFRDLRNLIYQVSPGGPPFARADIRLVIMTTRRVGWVKSYFR